MSSSEGWCTHAITEDEFFINDDHPYIDNKGNKYNWVQFRQVAVILPADSYAKIKAYILKMCKRNQNCQRDLGKWQRKFHLIESRNPQFQMVN